MIEELIEWDKKALIFLNGFHTQGLDPVMLTITKTFFWTPLYLFFIFLIFKTWKKEGWMFLLGAIITIVLSDQITSSLMKPFFERLRPSHDPTVQNLLHLVNDYRGSLYGFASSHAANTFGIAMFMWLAFRGVYRWIFLVFIWAALMTYTRIYLGVHFPGDILVGALVGMISGWLGFRLSLYIKSKKAPQPSQSA